MAPCVDFNSHWWGHVATSVYRYKQSKVGSPPSWHEGPNWQRAAGVGGGGKAMDLSYPCWFLTNQSPMFLFPVWCTLKKRKCSCRGQHGDSALDRNSGLCFPPPSAQCLFHLCVPNAVLKYIWLLLASLQDSPPSSHVSSMLALSWWVSLSPCPLPSMLSSLISVCDGCLYTHSAQNLLSGCKKGYEADFELGQVGWKKDLWGSSVFSCMCEREGGVEIRVSLSGLGIFPLWLSQMPCCIFCKKAF